MNINIETEVINTLLGRKEITVKIDNQGATPKNDELITALSSALNADSNLIVIDTISQTFGSQESIAYAKVYDSEELLKKVEPQPKKKEEKKEENANVPDESGEIKVQVDEPDEGEKPEVAPKEEAAEEKPAEEAPAEEAKEEKKEEAPAEEKPAEEAKEE